MDIPVYESFSDEELVFEQIEKKSFESLDVLQLKLEAEKISRDNQISELISYPEIAERLEYKLAHQPEGALRILRDFGGTGLLADEVGLGKTITAGIVLKECLARGFVKRALILTPPSLVDQWVAELKEKFNLNATIIESEADWDQASIVIASIDRVKTYDKDNGKFKHWKAHEISWDLLIVD